MKLSFSEKCKWAKLAACLDTNTDRGKEEFYKLAKTSGLGEQSLTYYSNAYEAAEESGIRALTYRRKIPEPIQREALDKINSFLYNRVPVELRNKIGFLVKGQSNRITVFEKRPLFNNPLKTSCVESFQVRYTDFDNRWHLYWMRKFNKWWPYIPEEVVSTIDDCLREVERDAWGCFWG